MENKDNNNDEDSDEDDASSSIIPTETKGILCLMFSWLNLASLLRGNQLYETVIYLFVTLADLYHLKKKDMLRDWQVEGNNDTLLY